MSNATIVGLVALVVFARWRLKCSQSERYKLSGHDDGNGVAGIMGVIRVAGGSWQLGGLVNWFVAMVTECGTKWGLTWNDHTKEKVYLQVLDFML